MKRTFKDWITDRFMNIIIPISRTILYRRYEIIIDNLKDLKLDDGPYFVIGNHPTNYDPFIASVSIVKSKSRYIASAMQNFYIGQKIGLFLIDAIKKQKGRADLVTLRKARRMLDKGYNIFIYPEGNRNFYGETGHIYEAIPKLLKKFKYPVVSIHTDGGCLLTPRWADNDRIGTLKINPKVLLTKDDLSRLSVEEVFNKIKEDISFNDYEWNKVNKYKYYAKDKAHGIDSFLYMCPKCKRLFTVYGKGHDIYCEHCGLLGTINDYELLDNSDFENILDMGNIQRSELDNIKKMNFKFNNAILWNLDYIKFKKKKLGKYSLEYIDQTIILKNNKEEIKFDINKMNSVTVEFRRRLAFDYEGIDYLLQTDQTLIFYDIINKYGVQEEIV